MNALQQLKQKKIEIDKGCGIQGAYVNCGEIDKAIGMKWLCDICYAKSQAYADGISACEEVLKEVEVEVYKLRVGANRKHNNKFSKDFHKGVNACLDMFKIELDKLRNSQQINRVNFTSNLNSPADTISKDKLKGEQTK